MRKTPTDYLWSLQNLGQALEPLARSAGLRGALGNAKQSADTPENTSSFEDWSEANLSKLGLEAEAIRVSYGEAEDFFRGAAPAILEYIDSQHSGFFVLLRTRGQRILLLKPDQSISSLSRRDLVALVDFEQRESLRPEIDALLKFAEIDPVARARIFEAFLKERLKNTSIGTCWRVCLHPGSDFGEQVRHTGAIPLLFSFFVSHAVASGLLLIFWGLLGNAVFNGAIHAQTLWLLAGILLLLGPLYQIPPWLYGILSIRVGERLKQRLLYGALRLGPDEIRHQGLGQFLGRVIETEAIETSAMRGSVSIFKGLIQLIVIIPYLASGIGGWFQVAMLCVWTGVSLAVGWRYLQARVLWTRTRLNLTNDLVEQLLGYRTRLAQQPHAEWHLQEEKLLAEYDRFAMRMDLHHAWLKAALPHGWTLAASLSLLPFLLSSSSGITEIALAVSGIVFASISFHQIVEGLIQFSDTWVAWDQVHLLFEAAGRPLRSQEAQPSATMQPKASEALLVAKNLRFRYSRGREEILSDCNFSIHTGDRVLLQGASGSGKSTLAAVLSGLRQPQQGILTLGGKAEMEIGERAWRKRIVTAPQFHENHIFAGTFAFNLLMGRCWPPTQEDLQKAKEICIALGLGDLLEEMPGGMFQFVGETGWQLSHGEKSRVYIARTLLQGADVMVLDESFSALDAGSLRQSLECVIEHAPTLVVVAHP